MIPSLFEFYRQITYLQSSRALRESSSRMSKEPIHSGHFMTSNPHEIQNEDEDEDVEVGKVMSVAMQQFFLG